MVLRQLVRTLGSKELSTLLLMAGWLLPFIAGQTRHVVI